MALCEESKRGTLKFLFVSILKKKKKKKNKLLMDWK